MNKKNSNDNGYSLSDDDNNEVKGLWAVVGNNGYRRLLDDAKTRTSEHHLHHHPPI